MPTPKRVDFSFVELAELLVRDAKLEKGHWGIFVQFGLGAANVSESDEGNNLRPAAIVPIVNIGIQQFDEPNNLTVDAAVVSKAAKT